VSSSGCGCGWPRELLLRFGLCVVCCCDGGSPMCGAPVASSDPVTPGRLLPAAAGLLAPPCSPCSSTAAAAMPVVAGRRGSAGVGRAETGPAPATVFGSSISATGAVAAPAAIPAAAAVTATGGSDTDGNAAGSPAVVAAAAVPAGMDSTTPAMVAAVAAVAAPSAAMAAATQDRG
jgi:hypothetical protein